MIVRDDLPPGTRLAQTIHAAGETGPAIPGTYAVALAVPSEAALLRLHEKLNYHGIRHALVREPDFPHNSAAMAIGIPPQARGALRPFLKEYRTCR